MKALALIGSGLLAAAALAMPGATNAQRHGYHGGYGHSGYRSGYRGGGYGHRYHAYRHGRRYGYRSGYRGHGYRYGYRHDHYRYARRGCRAGVYYSARRCY